MGGRRDARREECAVCALCSAQGGGAQGGGRARGDACECANTHGAHRAQQRVQGERRERAPGRNGSRSSGGTHAQMRTRRHGACFVF